MSPTPATGPRVALVTGASGGLGRAIAERLAADGDHVVLSARRGDELEAVAEGIRAAGGSAESVVLDVTDREAVVDVVAGIHERHGRLDVLVNNAGHNVRQPAENVDLDTFERLLELLLVAPFHLAQQAAIGMRARGFGRIVNIGSVAGSRALPTGVAYASAKAGLEQMTRVLAREWGGFGITVNLVAPWYVPTPLTEGVLAGPAFHEAVVAATPAGRLGTPAEVAAAVAFFAGAEAGWVNGVVLPLDGGFSAASFFPPA
ncbi:MAG: SDR family oxidoreductase [Planctomycetes bacterium]|nr:SDR family oxidoreductase [Planctomycetota bacterium]